MELTRRTVLVYVLLVVFWAIALGWQINEHQRVTEYAQNGLRNRSKDIASTLGAFIRGLQFRGAVFGNSVQPVLDELVSANTNDVFRSGEVLSVALLNAAGETVASAGLPLDLDRTDILQEGERWGARTLTVVYPVEGAAVAPDGGSNVPAPILLPRFTNSMRDPRGFRREPRGEGGPPQPGPRAPDGTNMNQGGPREGRQPPMPGGEPRSGRPFWARRMNDQDYQQMIQKRELHGVVLAMSTETYQGITSNDLRLRAIIVFFATAAALGIGLAWRNIAKTSDLQLRLVRASELNSHLKEMNLAAAGLAHETRNPLNIIRGLAQMISRQHDATPEIQKRSREVVDEADKVAAQLNEFINYSRPREVRRLPVLLSPMIAEVVRTLNFDLEEKQIRIQSTGDQIAVQADEQMFRQALFNLLLNAAQAVAPGGEIQIASTRTSGSEATLEIRDNGPGVPEQNREQIFKPYFTTQKTGTGLGLAVVQQIVLAHGWEIECLPNSPRGAVFRIKHLQVA